MHFIFFISDKLRKAFDAVVQMPYWPQQ